MNKSGKIKIDSKGIPFSWPEFWLDPYEYAKICSEINLIYDMQYKGKRIGAHPSFGIDGTAYIYWFEIHGFNDYNIYMRFVDEH